MGEAHGHRPPPAVPGRPQGSSAASRAQAPDAEPIESQIFNKAPSHRCFSFTSHVMLAKLCSCICMPNEKELYYKLNIET